MGDWPERGSQAAEFVVLLDRDLRIAAINQLHEGHEDPTGQSVLGFLSERDHAQMRRAAERALQSGLPQHLEVDGAGPEGETSHYSDWLVPLGGAEGPALALIAVDVTHTRRMQDALAGDREALNSLMAQAPAVLRESEERFRVLFEHAPEALVILDVDSGLFIEANEHACNLFGCSRAELLKFGPGDLSPPLQPDGSPSAPVAMRHVQQAVNGSHEVFEWTHQRVDGEAIPCEVRLVRLPHPQRAWVRGSITDIRGRKQAEAERKRLAAELAQAQKLQAIGELTGGIAHDFNNLLTVIMSHVEMISLDEQASAQVVGHAARSMEACQRAASLTQRLLAFARQQPLRPRVVDVDQLVRGLEHLLHRTLGEMIAITTRSTPDLWTCEVDPAQLENAVLNLAINARDAMPSGGSLTIETSNVQLEGDQLTARREVEPGPYVLLSVTDTGSGIEPDLIDRVFEPFFTTKEVGRGSGLGLSMVYGFVNQSGGHVNLRSEVGRGTSVRIYLPRVEGRVSEPRPQPAGEPQGDGSMVLVVEDNDDVRTTVVEMLEQIGYQTRSVAGAEAALELLSTVTVDLLLTDVVLAGTTNGFELAQAARSRRGELRVLLMSGYSQQAIANKGGLNAGLALLEKPFSRRELAIAVDRVLREQANLKLA